MHPLISIITPHFNRAKLLVETGASVLASSFSNWEWIIVDDGSTPEAWDEIQAWAKDDRIRLLRRENGQKGPSRCRNLGLGIARAELVIFLDSDDLLGPWCLHNRLVECERHPTADLWVFPVMLFDRKPGDSDLLWNSMGGDTLGRFLRSDGPWCVSSPIWKAGALRSIGGFNEMIMYGDDGDLHIRALASGLKAIEFRAAVPDVFIRRSNAPRITNSLSETLLESRRIRLKEGTRFLRSRSGFQSHLAVWHGQYLVETEFLLFNHEDPRHQINLILSDWWRDAEPWVTHHVISAIYLRFALCFRKHAYILLRIARRVVMKILPESYFPRSCDVAIARIDDRVADQLADLVNSNPDLTNPIIS